MFNWSAVIVLLPLEIATGYLYHLTKAIVDSMDITSDNLEMEMLKAITEPFTKNIIEVRSYRISQNKGKQITVFRLTAPSSDFKTICFN